MRDYGFEEHFGKPIASYPPRAVLFDYIEGRVKKAGVRDWIRFNENVRDVRHENGKFTVISRNSETDTESTEEYDHVVVASGHFSTPNVPHYPGFETFNGRILHAHDFRDAREFAGKDVLLIGASYSAEDIGSQVWKYGAKSITQSSRNGVTGYKWPDNWTEIAQAVDHVEGKTVHFADGSTKDVDAILLCTGYKHHFPFLPDELRLKTANILASDDLYKGVVWNHNPDMFYLGMQDQWYTFNMFDAQAWYVRDIIMDKIAVPDMAAREADVAARKAEEAALADDFACIDYQGAYTQELIDETDYPSFDIKASNQAFYEWKKHKKADIMTFRNYSYTSPMTGTKAPPHHTPWKDALDDSKESYLDI